MLYSIGCKLSDRQPEDYRIRDAIDRQKAEVFNYFKHLDKSVLINSFHLPLTNTKIINQYRLTYTPCGDLNSLPFYVTEIR